MGDTIQRYLEPTAIIDSDHPSIIAYASQVIGKASGSLVDQAVKLYYAVRDNIRYTPYYPFYRPSHYRASNVLKSGKGYCVSKAALLCALGRARNIPSRLGFADVKNHLATQQLIAYLGSDLFVFHGYVEFYLDSRWIKATPAFNAALCRRHNVDPLPFNGREDSIFQSYNLAHEKFMDYVTDHGVFADVPVERIVTAWRSEYGDVRVEQWIDKFERYGLSAGRNFYTEDVI